MVKFGVYFSNSMRNDGGIQLEREAGLERDIFEREEGDVLFIICWWRGGGI